MKHLFKSYYKINTVAKYTSLLIFIILWSSCRNDFETTPYNDQLTFSRDTVYLDTVFSTIGSSTYTLKVYNHSNNTISIPNVSLGQGEDSHYRLNIDGVPGKVFQNVEILKNDSIYVFIETTIDYGDYANTESSFLYTDVIQFESESQSQQVPLITLVQDAIFLFPQRDDTGIKENLNLGTDEEGNPVTIEGFFLDDEELLFTNEKPYIIFGYAAVAPNKTLTIEAGTRIHMHQSSGIIVANNASIQVNGRLSTDLENMENEVVFESDRLEPDFNEIPGQWGTIWLTNGSINNSFNYATIKNATVGILVESGTENNVHISNTQIYNSSNIGLYALNSRITGENIVTNNSGISSVWLRLGGNYDFKQCTLTNFTSALQGFRRYPSVQIDNFLATEEVLYVADLTKADFSNCIITGNQPEEFSVTASPDASFNFTFQNCLIDFQDNTNDYADNPLYNLDDFTHYENVIFNGNALFKDTSLNDLRIPEESDANSVGAMSTAQAVPFDILGILRSNPPDLGAYESALLDEEDN